MQQQFTNCFKIPKGDSYDLKIFESTLEPTLGYHIEVDSIRHQIVEVDVRQIGGFFVFFSRLEVSIEPTFIDDNMTLKLAQYLLMIHNPQK